MKKLFALLFFLSLSLQAQYKISGEMNPPEKFTWAILYKIEGARQVFIKSSTVKKVTKGNKTVGAFNFTLANDAKIGTYRVSYKTEGSGFVDFLFNKEKEISFSFNPNKAEETVEFSKSVENKLYQEYTRTVAVEQFKTDSLQIAYIKNPNTNLTKLYQTQLAKIAALQKEYVHKSKGKMAGDFIKATNRYNRPVLAKNGQEYMKTVIGHFFDTVDFSNTSLYNSAFIIDRITEYIFYMNYSDDAKTQNSLHKKAVETVFNKAKDIAFKRDIIEYVMTQFVNYRKIDFADYLMKTYYKKLPVTVQNKEFVTSFNEKTVVSIGRTAPEITWKEKGKDYKLSTLNEAKNYVLVFWSTGCSHCLREIPMLYTYTQNSKNTKVIAFSLENNDKEWKKHIQKYPKWHNVIGLKKWENPTARTYQIYSTPTYLILDKDKKIIAKPETLNEVKKIVEYLEQ